MMAAMAAASGVSRLLLAACLALEAAVVALRSQRSPKPGQARLPLPLPFHTVTTHLKRLQALTLSSLAPKAPWIQERREGTTREGTQSKQRQQ